MKRERRRSRGVRDGGRTESVEITAIAAGGEGVGRMADGRVIFVHRTAPGETVEARIIDERKKWARGRLIRVLRSAPERREAPCPHYARCGGCTLEHLDYAAQLRAKARIVGDAVRRIAGLAMDDPPIVASPGEFRYRNRVTFTLRRAGRRQVVAGFHELHHPERIVPIDRRCLLPESGVAASWEAIRENWGPDANYLPSGETLRLTVRRTAAGHVGLLIEGGYGEGKADDLIARVPELRSIWWRPAGDSTAKLLAGSPTLEENWRGTSLRLGGATFLQVNREAAGLLEDHVAAVAGDVSGSFVIDAYCGVGAHARRFAERGADVVGIELDPAAIESARAAGPDGPEYRAGRVEDLLPEALPGDLLIVNPPRAGLGPDVTSTILSDPPARMLYVSCDPATLARDLKRLFTSYSPSNIRCFDLFPQTAHVETVVLLERR